MDEESEKLQQKTVVSQVMERIKDLIATGQYKPGDRIPTEQELAARFGTGRSSIREAIRIFHHLGVVETKVPKGTFVCDRSNIATEAITWALLLGNNDRFEVLELRRVLEEQGFRALAEGYGAGDPGAQAAVEGLEREVAAMRQAAEAGSYEDLTRADFRFHERIIGQSSNRLFAAIFQTLHNFTEEEIRVTHVSLADLLEVVSDHRDIVESLKRKDPGAAVQRHRAHFDRIRGLLG